MVISCAPAAASLVLSVMFSEASVLKLGYISGWIGGRRKHPRFFFFSFGIYNLFDYSLIERPLGEYVGFVCFLKQILVVLGAFLPT